MIKLKLKLGVKKHKNFCSSLIIVTDRLYVSGIRDRQSCGHDTTLTSLQDSKIVHCTRLKNWQEIPLIETFGNENKWKEVSFLETFCFRQRFSNVILNFQTFLERFSPKNKKHLKLLHKPKPFHGCGSVSHLQSKEQ